jgi:hypothetical protein
MGPEMPLVRSPRSFTCAAERLTRAGSGPNWALICPSCTSEGTAPDANPCEEVALSKFKKFFWSDITDAPIIDNTVRDVSLFD